MCPNRPDTDDPPDPDDAYLLSAITEHTNDALWVFTADFEELVFVNSAYEDIFGGSVDDLREDATAFLERVHPDDRDDLIEGIETVGSGTKTELEFRVNPDVDYGTWVWVQAHPVYDDSGEMEYVVGYTRDISKRKEYRQELEATKKDLEKSNEGLREFAYIASHDLQEPLRMVSSYVDLLDAEYGDQLDDEAAEYMAFAVDGAQRMKRMIDSLLEYSRVQTNAKEFEETDTADVLEDTRQDLALHIDEHDAEVSVDDLPTVTADREQLGQLFQNLVKNAVEHGGEGDRPKVEVTATKRDGSYEFAVSDNGPGIPADEQDDIFDIFHRGASTSNTDSTGIGLAVSRRIAQRHGGRIWVESEAGQGATFKFTIPETKAAVNTEIDHG